ncbi:MAG: flavodoxin [Spirochaetaceae bacterium]|nr:flavodoxin [Spirochaetaceae bacterium]
MEKVLISYWSSSGNTELMAKQLAKGVSDAGAEAVLTEVGKTTPDMVKAARALAFGCPAMGDEELEEGDVEPFISKLTQAEVGGKALGLFGSYDWGDGQWMRSWVERMKKLDAKLDGEGVIAQLEPDEAALAKCYELGKRLAV